MTHEHLATYLNDHLAGAVAALELLEQLEKAHAGTPVAQALSELRVEIEADRGTLQSLMLRLRVTESGPRKATAWLAERLAWLKLRMDDSGHGAFRLFESLEAVSLGVEGKIALWRTLSTIAPIVTDVGTLDYGTLMLRAADQRARVEALRLGAALAALAATQPSA
ncbi:MAG: hypothetical protein JWL95_2999 [Gemmatimonadetes bacterium]|nr:hypothetical protein [Gemmatimonadota bacterium]